MLAGSLVLAALLLASCSGSDDKISDLPTPSEVPEGAVAVVADSEIPEGGFEAALKVGLSGYDPLSPTRVAPEPLDPPKFTRCIAAIQARAKNDPDLNGLGREAFLSSCRQRYDQLRTLTLSRLIQEEWVRTEAGLEGIEVSGQEVDALLGQLRLSWASKPAESRKRFRRAVEASGISPGELRQRAELVVLRQRLASAGTGGDDTPSPEDVASAEKERFDAWRAKTLCAEKLLVPECSNAPDGAESD